MHFVAAAGAAPQEIRTTDRENKMSIRMRVFAAAMTISTLAALALVAGADYHS
jgi:hypothetical protein